MKEPGYYAVIPATVRYDDRLQPNAKLLYGEITALCNKEGYCFATNSYFSKLYGVAITTISEWIQRLELSGHIACRIDKSAGNQRRIYIVEPNVNNMSYTYSENPEDPIQKNPNTYSEKPEGINNTINSTVNKKGSTKNVEPTLFEEATNKKTLFRNSVVADENVFRSQFKGQEYENVNLKYYYDGVLNWSDKANKMRTARGWIATAKDFMRTDAEKGKLKRLVNFTDQQDAMKEYLKS